MGRRIDRFWQTLLNADPRPSINFTGSALSHFRDVAVEFLCARIKGATVVDDDEVELYDDDGFFCRLRFRDEKALTELLLIMKEKRPCQTNPE